MKSKLLASVMLVVTLMTQSVYAGKVVTPASQKTTEKQTEATTQAKQSKSKVTSAMPFSTDGNLTLDDELSTDDDKEFYTVHTRSGAQFYIIIDKAAKTDNVYFLNEVDEADLMTILSENGISIESEEEETTLSEESSAAEDIPAEKSSGGEGSTLPIFIIAVAAGVIIVYKIKKKNKNEPDDDDDDEDSETEEAEDEEPEHFTSERKMNPEERSYGDDEEDTGSSFENREKPQFESTEEDSDSDSYDEDIPDDSVDDIDVLDD